MIATTITATASAIITGRGIAGAVECAREPGAMGSERDEMGVTSATALSTVGGAASGGADETLISGPESLAAGSGVGTFVGLELSTITLCGTFGGGLEPDLAR